MVNRLVVSVIVFCAVASAVPTLVYRLIDRYDSHTCVAAAHEVVAGRVLAAPDLMVRRNVDTGQLPSHPARSIDDIVGRVAEEELHQARCISLDALDVERVPIVVAVKAVIGAAIRARERVDLVVSPSVGADRNPGLVVKRAIVGEVDPTTVTFLVTDSERASLATQVGRAVISVSPTAEDRQP